MRNKSGFTIFELAVVIAIMAIVASIAVPSLIGWLPNYRMSSASDELLSTLWLAQRRAIRENADVAVDFDFGNNSYVVCVDTSNNANCDVGEEIVKSVQMPGGIDLVNDGLGNFQFDRRGFPTDTANNSVSGSILVRNNTTEQKINMTLAGSCTIE